MYRRSGKQLRRCVIGLGTPSPFIVLNTIIIPTLNEASEIEQCLRALQALREQGYEVIVADGGSTDGTPKIAEGLCDRVVSSGAGRAWQMNAAARVAVGEVFFFLHADTRLPPAFDEALHNADRAGAFWGRFDLVLSGGHWAFRVIETLINLRSRLTGIATGDQVMFMSRAIYQAVGGFPDIDLMEDVAMSRKLKRIKRPICLRHRVVTSSRRWERHGIVRTVMNMWRLRWLYFWGADPARLAKRYD